MIKFAILIVIVVLCYFAGNLMTIKYKRRKNFFSDFKLFHERLIREVAFVRDDIITFCNKFEYGAEFSGLIKSFTLSREDNGELVCFDCGESEEAFIKNYFSTIGKSDAMSELKFLNSQTVEIDAMRERAEKENDKYKNLYPKLGFLLGLTIAIILV